MVPIIINASQFYHVNEILIGERWNGTANLRFKKKNLKINFIVFKEK